MRKKMITALSGAMHMKKVTYEYEKWIQYGKHVRELEIECFLQNFI